MLDTSSYSPRNFAPGIGRAVADRTVARLKERPFEEMLFHTVELPRDDTVSLDDQVARYAKNHGMVISGYHVDKGDDLSVRLTLYQTGERTREDWWEVADRVALGNASLSPSDFFHEMRELREHLRNATILMSGRHLQHGDENQRERPHEVFSNCSTAPLSFLSFYLLLNGSGVGRDYSDDIMAVNFAQMPITVPAIREDHPDVVRGLASGYPTVDEIEHLYQGRKINYFTVPDSREGWAMAMAVMETMAYQGRRDEVLVLDFSEVRENGAPIGGMQDRPASGPGPLMSAIVNIAKLRDAGMKPWRAALYADHYAAAVVLVGGARRAARIATKWWRDPDVLDFIRVKRGGKFLWSANNSVSVDAEFWQLVKEAKAQDPVEIKELSPDAAWAEQVFDAVMNASYHDGTGEPGFVNVDKFDAHLEDKVNLAALDVDKVFDTGRLGMGDDTKEMLLDVVRRGLLAKYPMIVNPCSEIQLVKWGAYCIIGDGVPFHADTLDEAENALRAMTRALIRTNLMDALYKGEVARTNRIGVGLTGLHEFAMKFFGYGWHDLVDEEKSRDFWETLARFSQAVKQEAKRYATKLGLAVPHTDTTIKPAGTTSKLFGLTEGAHLPPMLTYLRWVQFRSDDPLVEEYRAKGYPVKDLKVYEGTTVVGFPTMPTITDLARNLGLEHKLVTAGEATPEEQFQYLRLLEKYWIAGNLDRDTGNQVSYTLKYDPARVSFRDYERVMRENLASVKCVSVMPQIDVTAYEYQPEEPVTKAEYERIAHQIEKTEQRTGGTMEESIDLEHIACDAGGCPVSFSKDGI